MKLLKQVLLVMMISSVAFLQGAATGLSVNEMLLQAARTGELKQVQELLTQDANVDYADNDGRTALHWASTMGRTKIVQELLTQGADVNYANSDNWTALHFAARYGYLETVQKLLTRGANVDYTDNDSWTALHWAAINGHANVVQYLVSQGANVDYADNDGWTALHFAARYGYPKIVQYLLTQGADVGQADNDGFTALHFASTNGHIDVISLLLAYDAQPEVETSDTHFKEKLRNKTALELACLEQGRESDNYLSTCAILQAATAARKEMPLDVTSVLTKPLPSQRKAAISANSVEEYDVSCDEKLMPLGSEEYLGRYSPMRYKIKSLSLKAHIQRQRELEKLTLNFQIERLFYTYTSLKRSLTQDISNNQEKFNFASKKNSDFATKWANYKENWNKIVSSNIPDTYEEVRVSSKNIYQKKDTLILANEWLTYLHKELNLLNQEADQIKANSIKSNFEF